MKLSITQKKTIRQGLYALMIVLPSVFTGNIYSKIDRKQSTDALLSSLNALSSSLYTSIQQSQGNLSYCLSLLLTHEEFTRFDIGGMSKLLGNFLYYNAVIGNAYIVDHTGAVIYGIDDTTLSGANSRTHIDDALKGSTGYYSTFIKDKPFVQFASPIYSIDPTTSSGPIGALVLTYNFKGLEDRLNALNSSSSSLNGYIIDTNGRIIAGSSNATLEWKNRTVDINKIKQGLDYDPSTTFVLFDETLLNGIYYTLPDTGWTLLITSLPHQTVEIVDIISWLAGALGLGGVTTSEAVRKKLESVTPPSDIPNIDPPINS